MHRREVLIGAAGATLAAQTAAAQSRAPETNSYDYLFVRLTSGASGRPAFLAYLADKGRKALAELGGEIIGVFTPQLGWDSSELAVLIRWHRDSPDRNKAYVTISAAPQGVSADRHKLSPTIRPREQDSLRPGGIYVHRWFLIKSTDRDEFVRLSSEGWKDFESRFAANIFGLFADEPFRPREPNIWLLLLTRYADHGVWEASRDPTTDAMRSFQRRAQLTLSSRGCSTLLAALPGT